MTSYLLRRLCLLPLTLFVIILVNFVILNLTPGDPVGHIDVSATGDPTRSQDSNADIQHLQFREHYGLTLPILWNRWPHLNKREVSHALDTLTQPDEKGFHEMHALKTLWGDRARFIMPLLLEEAQNTKNSFERRKSAANLFVRGGTRQGFVGPTLSKEKKLFNQRVSEINLFLSAQKISSYDALDTLEEKVEALSHWFDNQEKSAPSLMSDLRTLFFETRFFRYFSKVVTLDFGTLRNDNNKTVIEEVTKRMKYSLTLAVLPMLITFVLCQVFGMIMATQQNRWPDYTLNMLFLVLFAIPIFVVAPFLIEKVALHHFIPFTKIPIPFSGFHSPHSVYSTLTSSGRLFDITLHIFLPLIAIMYGSLAVQSRLSRTAFLEVLRQDYVTTARAKGLSRLHILVKHVGRNGAITIVTSLAASLGVILGGSLIIETVFEINGFGRFFYEAILNRDYNVVLFSAFAGSLLTLVGYLLADIAYTFLDPRVKFE